MNDSSKGLNILFQKKPKRDTWRGWTIQSFHFYILQHIGWAKILFKSMNQTSSQTLFFFVSHLSLHPFTFRHDPWLDTREFSRCLSGLGWQISFALRGNKSSHGKSNKLSFRFWFSAVFRDFLHHSVQGYVTHQTFPPLFLVARVQDLCLEGCEVFSVWNWHC